MVEVVRVLVPLDSQTSEAIGTALGYAKAICEKEGVRDIILLTHTKTQLNHSGLASRLGNRTIKALAKGAVTFEGDIQLYTETMRTLRWPPRRSVVIVYYAEAEILDFVDGIRNLIGVVAVPDIPGTADDWAERWGVIVHGAERRPPVVLIDDPVVVRALENLTQMVNLSTGLGHPRDKAYANEILRILRANGHENPTTCVRSWAIRNGWKPENAVELEALSRKIWGLKGKPSLDSFRNWQERYRRWKCGED